MNNLLKEAIQDRADQHNQARDLLEICSASLVWIFLCRVKEGYPWKLEHMWHGPFRVIDKCGNHDARLEIAGTPYQGFPVVNVAKLKLVRMFPDQPMERLIVNEAD